ncbi:hypothetical protein C6499_06365 [Candidatus Poribacteria bacterium]|nr:MAG: hypothetical protein C6499_06365 [Candidatus Poribacteria bacterium]
MFVSVKSKSGKKLMPTHPNKAGMLIKKGLATPYWSNGIFCIRLNYVTEDEYTQDIVVGVDPGSKKEGFTVKSESHTYLNIQADAHNKVGKKVAKRSELRRSRRSRKCPNRRNRKNRNAGKEKIPAGTRARWDWKLRILSWLSKLYPVTHVCVEDIKAPTIERARKWNTSFSPLEVGKKWFYDEIRKRWSLLTLQGYQTKEIRDRLGLKKSSKKLLESFDAHCVDSWCLAYHAVGGESIPDYTDIFCISPIKIKRRELHRQKESKGRIRSRQGGTVLGNGLIKNTLIKHVRYGITRLAGVNAKGLFSVYNLEGNKRITTGAKRSDFRVLTRLNFNYRSGYSSQA